MWVVRNDHLYLFKLKRMNKLTAEQIERLNELEDMLKAFLYDISVLKEDGENEMMDVSSLFDSLYDSVKEKM
jgi:hypothetical protein